MPGQDQHRERPSLTGRHQQPELAFSIFLGQSPPFSKHTKHVDFVSKPALASSGFVFIINREEVCTKGSLRPGRPQVTSLHPLALPLHPARPSPEGPAVVIVSLQGALVTHVVPRGVATAQTTEGLGVAGFSSSRDAAAPEIIANGCREEQREVTDPTFQLQVKKG